MYSLAKEFESWRKQGTIGLGRCLSEDTKIQLGVINSKDLFYSIVTNVNVIYC